MSRQREDRLRPGSYEEIAKGHWVPFSESDFCPEQSTSPLQILKRGARRPAAHSEPQLSGREVLNYIPVYYT